MRASASSMTNAGCRRVEPSSNSWRTPWRATTAGGPGEHRSVGGDGEAAEARAWSEGRVERARELVTAWDWRATSRVGEHERLGIGVGAVDAVQRIAPKVTVLPVPLLACTMRSAPSRPRGIAERWTGEDRNPASAGRAPGLAATGGRGGADVVSRQGGGGVARGERRLRRAAPEAGDPNVRSSSMITSSDAPAPRGIGGRGVDAPA